jgi:hypothetical protein
VTSVQTRTRLARELTRVLPKNKFLIFADGQDRDDIGKPTILMQRASVQPLPEAPRSYRANTFQVLVVSNVKTGDKAEDILDDLLDEVLDAISEIPDAFFSLAQRITYGTTNPAYEVTVTFPDDRQNKENQPWL